MFILGCCTVVLVVVVLIFALFLNGMSEGFKHFHPNSVLGMVSFLHVGDATNLVNEITVDAKTLGLAQNLKYDAISLRMP